MEHGQPVFLCVLRRLEEIIYRAIFKIHVKNALSAAVLSVVVERYMRVGYMQKLYGGVKSYFHGCFKHCYVFFHVRFLSYDVFLIKV